MKILEEFNMVPFFCRSKHEFIFTEGEKKQLAHVPCSLGKSSRTCHFMWKAMCTGGSWMLSHCGVCCLSLSSLRTLCNLFTTVEMACPIRISLKPRLLGFSCGNRTNSNHS